jgi:hypothetical protein
MDGVIGLRLLSVTRLAWWQSGSCEDFSSGPTRLLFESDRTVVLSSRSDWSLEWVEPSPGDDWERPYRYEINDGTWTSRDASTEDPFDDAIGQALVSWEPELDEVGDLVGMSLTFPDAVVTLRMWNGEVRPVTRA